jgi:predicted RNA polymerase sigma factor
MENDELREARQLLHSFKVHRRERDFQKRDATRVVDIYADGLVRVYEEGALAMEGRAELEAGRWLVTELPDDDLAHAIEHSLNYARQRATASVDTALAALMWLDAARLPGRIGEDGNLRALFAQDRSQR